MKLEFGYGRGTRTVEAPEKNLLAVWQVLSLLVDSPLLLPGPGAVLLRLGELVVSAAFWRVTAASLLCILCGAVLAVFCCRFSLADALLSPLLGTIRATPVASFIILLLDELFQGLDEVTRQQMADLIDREWAGKTLLLATHDLRGTELLNCRILTYRDGQFV